MIFKNSVDKILPQTFVIRIREIKRFFIKMGSTPVVPWLSYFSLDPGFAGSNPAVVDGLFSERTNPEYDFLRKGSKAVGLVSSLLRHVKETQIEIRASEQNLSEFSGSLQKATLMT